MDRTEILKLARGKGYEGDLAIQATESVGEEFLKPGKGYQWRGVSDLDAIIELAEFIWGKKLKRREQLYRSSPHERSFIAVQQEEYRYHLHNLLDWVIEGRDAIEYVEESLKKESL